MNVLYDVYNKQLKKFNQPLPSLYRVVKYTLGHYSLVLMCESKGVDISNETKYFITFEGVEYLQIIPSWENAPLELASGEMKVEFIDILKLEIDGYKSLPLIFYALPNRKGIFIVCTRIYLSEKMPRLSEYSFD